MGVRGRGREDGQMWVSVVMCLSMSCCVDLSTMLGCPQMTLPRRTSVPLQEGLCILAGGDLPESSLWASPLGSPCLSRCVPRCWSNEHLLGHVSSGEGVHLSKHVLGPVSKCSFGLVSAFTELSRRGLGLSVAVLGPQSSLSPFLGSKR